jgi:hypothetical protein
MASTGEQLPISGFQGDSLLMLILLLCLSTVWLWAVLPMFQRYTHSPSEPSAWGETVFVFGPVDQQREWWGLLAQNLYPHGHSLALLTSTPEDGGSMYLRNTGINTHIEMVLRSKRKTSIDR